jgi:nicotinate-nucleotide--dimethylbenzimidazole phosphoribosyltransferase
MSVDGWNSILVLGGIRSGKSEFAESLLSDVPEVTYLATAALERSGGPDPEWAERVAAHQRRRPESWTTVEVGADPGRLAGLLAEAKPDEALLVDDLGGWVTALLGLTGDEVPESTDAFVDATAALVAAVRGCAARLVLVSPEVGLSVVPATATGQVFADFLGAANRAVADACDAVVLVVAGQPAWLKRTGAASPEVLTPTVAVATPPAPAASEALTEPTMTLPMVTTGLVIQPGMDLPLPDEGAPAAARDRMTALDLAGAGFGTLGEAVEFAAGVQARPVPLPWTAVRVLLLHGDHEGGAAAGTPAGDSARRADQARAGEGTLAVLAATAGASLQVVDAATAAPIEDGPALTPEAVEAALRYGVRLAEEAVDSGMDLIVLGSCGAGAETAAAAVVAADTGVEPAALIGRVITPGGGIDDNAWMVRCGTVRDAVHRIRYSSRGPRELLAELGGGDLALATGVLLGAAARRTPVVLDGPVGVAAGLVARDLAAQTRHWSLLPDTGRHPTVKTAADILGLDPVLDLHLDLGEGANALAVLPLLQSVLGLVSTTGQHPAANPPE